MSKNYFLIFLTVLFSNAIIAQELNSINVIGKWKVVKVLKTIDNPKVKDLVRGFNAAVFEFKENEDFKLTTTDGSKLFSTVTTMTANTKWKLDTNNSAIYIGNASDGYSILKIIVSELNGQIIFHLIETELELEVQKE